jgi:hypothetical protein
MREFDILTGEYHLKIWFYFDKTKAYRGLDKQKSETQLRALIFFNKGDKPVGVLIFWQTHTHLL